MVVAQIDLGSPSHPWAAPVVGQNLESVVVEGYEPSIWSHGSIERSQSVSFSIKAWQAIGGETANTSAAMKYLLKQLEELASNHDLQPLYIQWTTTADPGALYNTADLHDGWYFISDLEPDYSANVVTGLVKCRMTVTQIAPAAPRSVALGYTGGALSTNFSGSATNLVSLPVGSTAMEANFTRAGGEGSLPCILSPVASPEPLVLPASIAQIYQGGVRVFDSIA